MHADVTLKIYPGRGHTVSEEEILLMEDTGGKGHRTRNLEKQERTSLFIHLD